MSNHLAVDQSPFDTHMDHVDGSLVPPANRVAKSTVSPPEGPLSPSAIPYEKPNVLPPRGSLTPSTIGSPKPSVHSSKGSLTAGQCRDAPQSTTAREQEGTGNDALLLIFADAVDDLERVRIATDNRLRSLRQVKGMEVSPEADRMEALAGQIAALEHQAILDLQRAMRAHPLGPFVKRTIGLGEKQAARLLAAIGDPTTRANVAKLWAYCGLHVIDGKRPRRQKGQQSNWNNTAKMRARLCAESCMKQSRSPYRPVYDAERAKWAERDTTDLHKHNHALAVVAKAILRDLWCEAKGLSA